MAPTLVIVDDDSLIGKTLAANLEDVGFQSEIFSSGREALNYLAAGGKAAAILLDWKMREMDGPNFLSELRARNCDVPVLVLTGYQKPGIKEQALSLGATAMLDKTNRFGVILEQIRRVLPQPESSVG